MVRSATLAMDIYDIFNRLPSNQRRAIANEPNVDYDERMQENMGRSFITERGINLEELAPTPIPNTVGARGWGRYVQTPTPYHPGLVQEFYAAMVPEAFRAYDWVVVRGRRVVITIDAINAYLALEPHPDLRRNGGMPEHEFFERGHDARVAAALRRSGDPNWNPMLVNLRHSELHPDLAIWNIFVKHSLLPSQNRTNVMNPDAQVLFAIQNDLPIDVGRVIYFQILDCGRVSGSLLFPCLITHFCRIAGIEEASIDEQLVPPMKDINRRTYNLFCTNQGLELLPTGRQARGRHQNQPQQAHAQQEEDEGHAEEAVPPPSPPVVEQGGLDPLNWQNQFYTLLQHQSSLITNVQGTIDTNHAEYITDRNAMNARLEEMQRYMYHSGIGYSRRPRDSDAGPSSQQPGNRQ